MKKKRSSSLIKISLIYLISNIVVKGIFFLTTPLFTRIMSQEEFGIFNNVSSWASIISIITTLCLYSSINRAKYDYNEHINEYMSTITLLGFIFTIVMWIIVEFNIPFFEKILDMNKIYIRSIMLYCLFTPAVQVLLSKYRIYNEYIKVVIVTWITLIITVISSLGLTYFMSDKVLGRTIGTYAVIGIVDMFFFFYIIAKGKRFSLEMAKYSCFLSLPLILHELSGVLLNSSDKIIIKQLCGPTDAALYSIAYTISMILTVILSSLNQAWVPWFYDKLHKKDLKTIGMIVPRYIYIFMIFCILLMLIGPEMVIIFGGKSYLSAVYVIPPVCLAIFIQFIYTLYVNIEFYLKRSVYISIATTFASIINIILNYLFIPKIGYVAAAYTTLIGFLLMFIFHYIICSRTEYNRIYGFKTIAISIIVSTFFMVISLILYKYSTIRLLLLIILVIIVVTLMLNKRKDISLLLKKLKKGKVEV